MKVYLASRYDRKSELCAYATLARFHGIEVTSRWLDGEENKDPASRQRYAYHDLDDIANSDVVVHFTESRETPSRRGGRHVESGYALGLGKLLAVVGERENIFYEMHQVHQFSSFNECLIWLQRLAVDYEKK